jgi:transposase-like protein
MSAAFDPNYHYDPLTVDALVQRYPVRGATTADKAKAAQLFSDRGVDDRDIAVLLGTSERNVGRWVNEFDVASLPPIAEWAQREDWPRCRSGAHEMTPDNMVRKGYDRNGQQLFTCRMCIRAGTAKRSVMHDR